MARNKGSRRASGAISRPNPTHTLTRPSARLLGPLDHPADVSYSYHSTPPLMRTVSGDRPGSRQSPVVRARATYRSARLSPWKSSGFVTPELTQRAMICARRAIRREVLFAIRGTGRGSRSRRNYTLSSKVRC